MSWVLLILCSAAFIELFLRLGVMRRVGALAAVASRSVSVLRSPRISDHWKERVLPRYAGRMAGFSLALFGLMVACLSPFFVALLVSDYFGLGFERLVVTPQAALAGTLVAIIYAKARMRGV